MLMRFFDDFVNFTGENSHFLSRCLKCKHPSRDKNWWFASPPRHFEKQIDRGSQRWISGWQNTIFSFLDAQLDFLAIFSAPPHYSTKYEILSDSSAFKICRKIARFLYLSSMYIGFCLFFEDGFFCSKNWK